MAQTFLFGVYLAVYKSRFYPCKAFKDNHMQTSEFLLPSVRSKWNQNQTETL